jgi:hypothetical protein
MVDANGFVMENIFVTYNFHYFSNSIFLRKKTQVSLSRLMFVVWLKNDLYEVLLKGLLSLSSKWFLI